MSVIIEKIHKLEKALRKDIHGPKSQYSLREYISQLYKDDLEGCFEQINTINRFINKRFYNNVPEFALSIPVSFPDTMSLHDIIHLVLERSKDPIHSAGLDMEKISTHYL